MGPEAITIGVSRRHRPALEEFVRAERPPWTLVDAPGGRVDVVDDPEPGTCDPRRLIPGGRIKCSTSLEMAEVLRVSPASLGRLLNLLRIKVRECQLGCF